MSLIKKAGKFIDLPAFKELEEAVQAVFLKMPDLTFEANKTRNWSATGTPTTQDYVSSVVVYSGNQNLGSISFERKYVRSVGEYQNTYAVTSPKIHKHRGTNRNTKYAKTVKAVINIAKEVLVPASKNTVAYNMINVFKMQFNSVVYTGCRDYNYYADRLGNHAFAYALSVVNGETPQMPPIITSEVQSEKFKKAHDTYRIIKSLESAFENKSGVIVRVEKDETISVAEIESNTMAMEVKSTYDLPKNYQEKFTILKIMDKHTPIEHVGIRIETEVNNEPWTLYYLVGGETVVTH